MFSVVATPLSRLVTRFPYSVIIFMFAVVGVCSVFINRLDIDSSPDSMMLESDPDLKYYRQIHRHYRSDEYIIAGFKPDQDILAREVIRFIDSLVHEFSQIEGVSGVTAMSNVPLLMQQEEDEETGQTRFVTLLSKNIDLDKARKEFASSPIYVDNLVSKDLSTTAIKVDMLENQELTALLQQKYVILDKQASQGLDKQDLVDLASMRNEIRNQRRIANQQYKDVLYSVREIIAENADKGEFYLAGVPMIAHDMKVFVVQDIKIFGLAIIIIMTLVLFVFFRKPVWVCLVLVCALLNVLLVSGVTALLDFQLTVISSNFVALLIIFSIALSIHVIIRYQEIHSLYPEKSLDENISSALTQIITPCFYMVLTSAIAFLSLMVSDINLVIVFGYMMVLGLFCAFLITFTVLPSLIKIMKPGSGTFKEDKSAKFLENILVLIENNKALTLVVILGILLLNIVGISNLTVENRFIDYFKKSTDIYQGLELVDTDLGGTVPLEVMLEAEPETVTEQDVEDEDDEFGDYLADLDATQDDFTAKSYWYNRSGIKKIDAIHRYLEALPQVGKVLSLASTEEVFRIVNKGEPLEDFHLSLVYSKVPEEVKEELISPYVSADGNQARIVARIKDSDHTLIRNDLLNKIKEDLETNFVSAGEEVRITGISVLYNNVLQSLFRSQILTLGTVFVCILMMLIVLFRSIKLAIIGTLPNIFTASFILGLMGIFGIPLDIMTITIAAITIGVGVDYAIHYIHRYKKEYAQCRDNYQAIHISQTTVGKALYFTSIVITLGFVILALSNFIPSIYFGMLTSIAMLVSLFATFSIIPLLLSSTKSLKI